jgi:hypothetical protein
MTEQGEPKRGFHLLPNVLNFRAVQCSGNFLYNGAADARYLKSCAAVSHIIAF